MEKTEIQKPKYSKDLAMIIKDFFTQWKYPVMIIYGNPDTGKTNTALLCVEIGLNEGVLDYFASNIQTYGKGERITSLEDLDFWFKNQTGRKCFILDEAGIHDDSRSPLSLMQRRIRHEVFVIRKFRGHIIFVLQELEDIDKWKYSELTGIKIRKTKIGNIYYAEIKTKWIEDSINVKDIASTTIPFDTFDIAPFTLEREIDDAEVELKGLPYQVAYLYAKHGNMSIITRELKEKTQKEWKFQQVKRLLQKYLREQLRIEVKRGRPRKMEVINDAMPQEKT